MPRREPPERFPVRFFLVAMIFIVFDIEIIFLFPWAVVYRDLGAFGLVEMLVFAVAVFVVVRVPDQQRRPRLGPGQAGAQPVADGRRPSAPAATTIRRVGLEGRLDERGRCPARPVARAPARKMAA